VSIEFPIITVITRDGEEYVVVTSKHGASTPDGCHTYVADRKTLTVWLLGDPRSRTSERARAVVPDRVPTSLYDQEYDNELEASVGHWSVVENWSPGKLVTMANFLKHRNGRKK
jgi:hypothetical protein